MMGGVSARARSKGGVTWERSFGCLTKGGCGQ